jgi:hypothetical protein
MKGIKMKKTFQLFCFAAIVSLSNLSYAEGKKKVCVDVKDKTGASVKDAKGKVKQNCKEMKVHKKLEGTAVPEKAKK